MLFVALVKRLDHVDASRMQVQRQSGMHRAKLTSGVMAKIHKSVSVEVVTERSRERLCAPREIERLGQTDDTFVNVANVPHLDRVGDSSLNHSFRSDGQHLKSWIFSRHESDLQRNEITPAEGCRTLVLGCSVAADVRQAIVSCLLAPDSLILNHFLV